VVRATPQLPCTWKRDPVAIVQEAKWAPGLVWTGVENLVPTGVRSLDHRTGSELLYLLCFPGLQPKSVVTQNPNDSELRNLGDSCTLFWESIVK